MAKEKEILKKLDEIKHNAQFIIPANYFNELSERVLKKINHLPK